MGTVKELPRPVPLSGDQVARQQVERAALLRKYRHVYPSSYAPVVEDARGVTFRFFVNKGDAMDSPSTMVEVRVNNKGGK